MVLAVFGVIPVAIAAEGFWQTMGVVFLGGPVVLLLASWPIALGRALGALADIGDSVSAFVVSVYLGATASRAVDIAIWVTIGLPRIFGYLVGRQSGATGWWLVVEIGEAALFGVAVAILKTLLH